MKSLNYIWFVLMAIVILSGCKENSTKDLNSRGTEKPILAIDSSSNETKKDWLSNADTTYSFGQGNEIIYDWTPSNFDTLSEEAFLKLKKTYQPSISQDSAAVIFSDSDFTIQTAKARMTFEHVLDPGLGVRTTTYYNGFVTPFKLFLVTRWQEASIFIGGTTMIDSVSNIAYNVISTSDGATEPPTVSHDHKFLMIHSYNYHYSNITILERIKEFGPKGHFKEVISFSLKGLVKDLAWIADNKISFTLDRQNYFDKNLTQTGYYISKLPVDQLKWKKIKPFQY
ncbi:MAG: hypothetical protein GQ574_29025 [Crocinitomix sp.]|nr:hypothetical protein [Crocinitomix sp.]